jgi:hypothetical protein
MKKTKPYWEDMRVKVFTGKGETRLGTVKGRNARDCKYLILLDGSVIPTWISWSLLDPLFLLLEK